ncbi:MAG: PepSY-associated TM helix domain-containing protein [Hyphomonadaceae bacterium]
MREAARAGWWPGYRAVWRWHFYAGLLCIPFILWLSVTGSIYLFRPQIEAWIDAPYARVAGDGPSAPPSAQVHAALAAAPGARLASYQAPSSPEAAVQILLMRKADLIRVYVHPQTLRILKIVREDDRFMRRIFHLHGELALGDLGSLVVELAACWAIILIVTGLFLWWPRRARGLAGVLYPRWRGGLFWRDLHAVTGFWISAFALFLLLTGLPWAANWGGYLKEIRALTGTADGAQDWTTGASSEHAERMAMGALEGRDAGLVAPIARQFDAALNRLVPAAARLRLAPPVLLSPPRAADNGAWQVRSDSQNRTLRSTVWLNPKTGDVVARRNFNERHPIDQIIGVGVSAHEGQLFGWANQLLGLLTALGLIAVCASALWLWLRRRPPGALGAPTPTSPPRLTAALCALILLLGVLFPLFGASLAAVLALDWALVRRVPPLRRWLGWSDSRADAPNG